MQSSVIYHYLIICLLLLPTGCGSEDPSTPNEQDDMYFPPTDNSEWTSVSMTDLGWNTDNLEALYTFLQDKNTRAFIVLKNGKIAVEKYWGTKINQPAAFDASSFWYWASAGKSLTATLTGIAQQEGDLDINDKTSDYLGEGWTSMTTDQEDMITIKHQLSMTTGLDYEVSDVNCTEANCLTYKSDAGTQWYYHNAPYTLIHQVISQATGIDYNQYTDQKIESKIGMDGLWIASGYNNIYWSTARDMARFGLLILNKGTWEQTTVVTDANYFSQMTSSSQTLNPSYGYLWWLNGKNSIVVPSLPNTFNTALSNHAPDDLYAGMGKNGQFVDVVPSLGLVVIRMGEASDDSGAAISFHDEMWQMINLVISN